MKSLPTRPVWPISGAPTSLSYSFGESPTPIFMSPSPSTCDLRPGMLLFTSLKRGIGPRSTSLLMSLGLCLRAADRENAWQVGLARRTASGGSTSWNFSLIPLCHSSEQVRVRPSQSLICAAGRRGLRAINHISYRSTAGGLHSRRVSIQKPGGISQAHFPRASSLSETQPSKPGLSHGATDVYPRCANIPRLFACGQRPTQRLQSRTAACPSLVGLGIGPIAVASTTPSTREFDASPLQGCRLTCHFFVGSRPNVAAPGRVVQARPTRATPQFGVSLCLQKLPSPRSFSQAPCRARLRRSPPLLH